MSKWYEIVIKAHKVMAVEMPDDATEEDAYNYALGECGIDTDCVIEGEIEELTTEDQIECSKRHADQVDPL